MRGYFLIYGVRQSRLGRLGRFLFHDWPAAVRALWKETLVVAAVLLLGVLTSWALVASHPDGYFPFLPEGRQAGRQPGATAEYLQRPRRTATPPAAGVEGAHTGCAPD